MENNNPFVPSQDKSSLETKEVLTKEILIDMLKGLQEPFTEFRDLSSKNRMFPSRNRRTTVEDATVKIQELTDKLHSLDSTVDQVSLSSYQKEIEVLKKELVVAAKVAKQDSLDSKI